MCTVYNNYKMQIEIHNCLKICLKYNPTVILTFINNVYLYCESICTVISYAHWHCSRVVWSLELSLQFITLIGLSKTSLLLRPHCTIDPSHSQQLLVCPSLHNLTLLQH